MKNNEHQEYIFVCTGKSCKKNGSKLLLKELKVLRTTKDGVKIRVVKTKCMDHCKKGPNAILHNQLYHQASFEELKSAL